MPVQQQLCTLKESMFRSARKPARLLRNKNASSLHLGRAASTSTKHPACNYNNGWHAPLSR